MNQGFVPKGMMNGWTIKLKCPKQQSHKLSQENAFKLFSPALSCPVPCSFPMLLQIQSHWLESQNCRRNMLLLRHWCLRHSTASPVNAKRIMKKQLQYMSCSQLTNEPWKSCQLGNIRLHILSLFDCSERNKKTNPISFVFSGCPASRGDEPCRCVVVVNVCLPNSEV